jgi:hypothetical protein
MARSQATLDRAACRSEQKITCRERVHTREQDLEIRLVITVHVAGDDGIRARSVDAQITSMGEFSVADEVEGLVAGCRAIRIDRGQVDVFSAGRKIFDLVSASANGAVADRLKYEGVVALAAYESVAIGPANEGN